MILEGAASRLDGLEQLELRIGCRIGVRGDEGHIGATCKASPDLRNTHGGHPEMALDQAIDIAVNKHLGGRNGREAESRWASDRSLLEQEGGCAGRDQIEKALVNFNSEVRPIKVPLDANRSGIENLAEFVPVCRIDVLTWLEPEPAGPRRRQLRQQARRELLHRVGRCSIEQSFGVIGAREAGLREAVTAHWQGVGIAVTPQRFPCRPALSSIGKPSKHRR